MTSPSLPSSALGSRASSEPAAPLCARAAPYGPLPDSFLAIDWSAPRRDQAEIIESGLGSVAEWSQKDFLAAMEHAASRPALHVSMAESALRAIGARVARLGEDAADSSLSRDELAGLAPCAEALAAKGVAVASMVGSTAAKRLLVQCLKADDPSVALALLRGRPMSASDALGSCCKAGAWRSLSSIAALYPSANAGPFLAKAIQTAIERPQWEAESPGLAECVELLIDMHPMHALLETHAVDKLAKRSGSAHVAAFSRKIQAMAERSALESSAGIPDAALPHAPRL